MTLWSGRRDGDDLVMKMDIELVEALCGFQKTITTLDKRSLVLTCIPGTKGFIVRSLLSVSPQACMSGISKPGRSVAGVLR